MSGDLIDTTEMYLRTIIELEEEGVPPLRARIAERLDQSSPTVSQTCARMERDGLLTVHEDRQIELSAVGRQRGLEVMRRHRLAERMLLDVLGVPLALVHEEACRWEHVITDVVEGRMFEFLGRPTDSPYGTPIPALDELGSPERAPDFLAGVRRLSECPEGPVRIVRFGENVQRDAELLSQLVDGGALPGAECSVVRTPLGLELTCAAGRCVILASDADHIFVAA